MSAPLDILAQLIAKARDNELTSSEIADCLKGLSRLNGAGSRWSVRVYPDGASIYTGSFDRYPAYTGDCAENALIAAYDDLQRILAEENAA